MTDLFRIEDFGNRRICIAGVGTMFHQEGIPIGMAAKELHDNGIELSWFHVIKELYMQYDSNDRLFSKIKAEIEDAKVEGISVDMDFIKKFCYADYDTQQEIIFQYLYSSEEDIFPLFKKLVNQKRHENNKRRNTKQ